MAVALCASSPDDRKQGSALVSESQKLFYRRGLWSLADMIRFLTPFVCQIYAELGRTSASLREEGWGDGELTDETKAKFANLMCLVAIETHSDVLDDPNLQSRTWTLRHRLAAQEDFTGEMLARELDGLLAQVMACVDRHKYAFIPSPNDQYFENERLFGPAVYESFPEARGDIKDAGNCIAASLYTAGVFHLMRVSEIGLRWLAKRLKISIAHKNRPQPIEDADWNKVIGGVRKKLDKAHELSRNNMKRSEKISLYSDMLGRAISLKDFYRNSVMHMRGNFGHHEALGCLERVKEFMEALCRL